MPRGAIDLGAGFVLLHPHDRDPQLVEEELLADFNNHLASCGITVIPTAQTRVIRWGRLLLPNGQIGRSAWKELQRVRPGRCSRNIKVYIYIIDALL